MQFDQCVQSILEALTPAYDGRKEYYGTRVTYDFMEDVGDYEEFHRLDEQDVELFEWLSTKDEYVKYKDDNLEQALHHISDFDVRRAFIENTQGLPGIYYVMRMETHQQNDDDEVGVSFEEMCVFELLPGLLRRSEIQKDLKDVDVTGLEDLL